MERFLLRSSFAQNTENFKFKKERCEAKLAEERNFFLRALGPRCKSSRKLSRNGNTLKWKKERNIKHERSRLYRYFDRLYNGDFKNNLNGKERLCTCENEGGKNHYE